MTCRFRPSLTLSIAVAFAACSGFAIPVVSEEQSGKEPSGFAVHVINLNSAFSACAVDDIDGDEVPDILCGAWWYAGPDFVETHFVRHWPQIRARYDGYSHLPYDVDGDDDTDFISVNYRSQSIFWIEHPDDLDREWPRHPIALPGASETGRLFDIDNDGWLDLLPNSVKKPVWLRFEPESRQFSEHPLPEESKGHGNGFGDINGDGRGDIVSAEGWLEAPADPVAGGWVWHPEFSLVRAGLPVLVRDIDADGDGDLIWGSGHSYGLFWEENVTDAGGKRTWIRHAIDESWSQAHALLWADLDGDGIEEVVTGKRYLAHDGHDDGAFDPLV
ncbi:MAG: VCBS repeat-containing protein, partial [Verrucomicrobiae bacterium]|nr:VCBS repeat-containing protein [Verrucomicrobiae bacterium]